MRAGQNIAYTLIVLLLIAALVLSNAIQGNAADYADLPPDAEHITPLKTGDLAPEFSVLTVDGEAFDFDPGQLARPVIFVSFRGGWCPYCNMHLSELRNVVPEIRALGVDVYFLSGDRPEILHTSLKRETRDQIEGLDYVILSDADIAAARAFGTAFRVDKGYISKLDKREYDLADSSIRNFGALPVPAVYVIDRSGRIAFDFVNADYKVRLPADRLLTAARDVAAQ